MREQGQVRTARAGPSRKKHHHTHLQQEHHQNKLPLSRSHDGGGCGGEGDGSNKPHGDRDGYGDGWAALTSHALGVRDAAVDG